MSHTDPVIKRFLQKPSNLALLFFAYVCFVGVLIGLMIWALISFVGIRHDDSIPTPHFAFLCSTGLLVAGSWKLHQAQRAVRIEKQAEFRNRLVAGVSIGCLFVAVQTFALWSLLKIQQSNSPFTGLRDSAFAFAVLHGVHFVVALMFVLFVYLRALADRYDHEYSWGVTFCAWFWHALGIVWVFIIGAFLIASLY